jgi:uncharacterized protein with ATP-grasp and redox domains
MCSEPVSFAEHTLLVRLPAIARRMIAENEFPDQVLQQINTLLSEIPDAPVRLLQDPGAPDLDLWAENFAVWLGLPWRMLSFLAAEKYFYRRIIEATGYFQEGSTHLVDPYQSQKDLSLQSSRAAVSGLARQIERWQVSSQPDQALVEAIESNLWGNRADLSIWPVGGANTIDNEHLHQAEEFLLANDLRNAVEHFLNPAHKGRPIHILVDNAGYELVNDLALADLLLHFGICQQVVIHVKAHPTFVSDAMIKDVTATAQTLAKDEDAAVNRFGGRLIEHVDQQRIQVLSDYFWNAPLAFWEMPVALRQKLGQAGLVLCKGDANYRRLTGDLRWPAETPFRQVTDYFPAPLLALRVAKSDVMVGLAPGQSARNNLREADWRTNGRWGMIQFKK